MPFKSERQRRFLWAKHPEIAQRWADESRGKRGKKKQKDSASLRGLKRARS